MEHLYQTLATQSPDIGQNFNGNIFHSPISDQICYIGHEGETAETKVNN